MGGMTCARLNERGELMARRSGFTLIELLVSITVIVLLLALTLPAIQHVRESSRSTQCRNNLKQIGIAIENYSSVNGMFPPGRSNRASLHVFLLPYLDQNALYQEYDFNFRPADAENSAVYMSRVDLYRCPSDPAGPIGAGIDGTNYAGNYGSGVQRYDYNGIFRNIRNTPGRWKGGPVRAASVRDGLSHTAAVSEILLASGSPEKLRTIWELPTTYPGGALLDEFAAVCEHFEPGQGLISDNWFRGRPWVMGDEGTTLYNHVLPPNRRSCRNGTFVADGIYTAASLHDGGVHVLYADGHVVFASESIDLNVWRAIGSRDGGELIDLQ